MRSVVALDIRGDCLAALATDATAQGLVNAPGAATPAPLAPGGAACPRPQLWTHVVDVADDAAVAAVCERVKAETGPLGVSVLINNAGGAGLGLA